MSVPTDMPTGKLRLLPQTRASGSTQVLYNLPHGVLLKQPDSGDSDRSGRETAGRIFHRHPPQRNDGNLPIAGFSQPIQAGRTALETGIYLFENWTEYGEVCSIFIGECHFFNRVAGDTDQ